MNSAWTRAVIVVLSLFVILVFIGQVFFTNRTDVKVETVYQYEFDAEIPFEGVFMRDETLIYDYTSGVLGYECSDGSKVGKSTVLARRYKSQNDVLYRRQIESLKKQIEVLLSAEELIGTDNSQLDAISAQINESHSKIISEIMNGDYEAADERQSELLEAMCKREITLRESTDYSARKQALNSEISRLNAMLSADVVDIEADGAGYFASRIDGYEDEITFSSVSEMTEEKIAEIIARPDKAKNSENVIGKLISDYRWRIAAVLDTDNMFGVNQGGKVTLRLGSETRLLEAEVVSVKPCGDNKAVYIFECDRLDASVVQGRTARFKIVVNSYGGLRIPRSALRYSEGGEYGVYAMRGQSVVFKKIDIIYWGNDYVICEQNSGDKYLKLYDEIVVEGKDLYDGKVVVR